MTVNVLTTEITTFNSIIPVEEIVIYYDVHDLKNYRPVFNLCFVSTLIERTAAKQLVD